MMTFADEFEQTVQVMHRMLDVMVEHDRARRRQRRAVVVRRASIWMLLGVVVVGLGALGSMLPGILGIGGVAALGFAIIAAVFVGGLLVGLLLAAVLFGAGVAVGVAFTPDRPCP